MKVSIITPTYNSAEYLEETLRAILAQTYPDWELLITDDGSADDTVEIIRNYAAADSRISYFILPRNSGADVARNNSISHAAGRFIAFCDSDDLWPPGKLEKQVAFMLENRYAFTFSPYVILDETGHETGIFPTRPRVSYNDLLRTCDIGCLTVMYDTEKLGKQLMPHIRKSHDYALWLQILKQVPFGYSYPEPLGYYRMRAGSVSRNKWRSMMYIWKVYREVEKLSLFRSLGLIGVYSFNGLWKYRKIWLNRPDQ
jgi:glycosyltransferase involved in cell wall biosynthesis